MGKRGKEGVIGEKQGKVGVVGGKQEQGGRDWWERGARRA